MASPTGPRPIALPVSPDPIPADLKASPQFVGWRYEWRDDKWTKPPICVLTGEHASSTDPQTWTTDQVALQVYQNGAQDLDGIGYVLTEADQIVGFDSTTVGIVIPERSTHGPSILSVSSRAIQRCHQAAQDCAHGLVALIVESQAGPEKTRRY